MSFMITVAVPIPGPFWQENIDQMKVAGMRYIPQRKCWKGEIASDAYDDVMIVLGEFAVESLHPNAITQVEIVNLIDSCADFKKVGR